MRVTIVALLVAFAPLTSIATDPVVGDRVFVKAGAVAKNGDAVVDIELISFPATVEDIDGELLWLARAWVRKSDVMSVDEALAAYSETVMREPSNVSAWRNRAYVWLVKNQPDKAMDDCNQAIRLDSKNSVNYIARAWAWIFKDRYEKSFQDCTTAIKLDPKSAHGYRVRGASWACQGDYRNAIKEFTEAIRLDPGDIDSYSARASARSEADVNGAIKDYTQVIRLDPKNAAAFHERGSLFEGTGDFGSALSDYGDNHRLNPKSAAVCNNIARILSACPDDRYRDGKKAVEYATKACKLRGREFWGDLSWLAAAYAESGDFANAVKWAEKALAMAPEYAKDDFDERLELYRANKPCRDMSLKYHFGKGGGAK
jgi:tetratricopeptide (TPR) repeat protein